MVFNGDMMQTSYSQMRPHIYGARRGRSDATTLAGSSSTEVTNMATQVMCAQCSVRRSGPAAAAQRFLIHNIQRPRMKTPGAAGPTARRAVATTYTSPTRRTHCTEFEFCFK